MSARRNDAEHQLQKNMALRLLIETAISKQVRDEQHASGLLDRLGHLRVRTARGLDKRRHCSVYVAVAVPPALICFRT